MKTGRWMARLDDVRETEDMLMDMEVNAIPIPLSGDDQVSRGSN
jgi:hypothetical protein